MNLAEWNEERKRHWEDVRRKVTHPWEFENGFTCPRCGGALYDTGKLLAVSPPILQVKCKQCGAKEQRYE